MAALLRLVELMVIIAIAGVRHHSCYKLADSSSSSAAATENGDTKKISSAGSERRNWREKLIKLLEDLNQEREEEQEFTENKMAPDHLYNTISSPEYLLDSEAMGESSLNSDQLNKIKRFSEFLGGKRKRSTRFAPNSKRFSEFLGGKRKRYSEFLGGKKRSAETETAPELSQILRDDRLKRFSEFLGGKRSGQSIYGRHTGDEAPVSYDQSDIFGDVRV